MHRQVAFPESRRALALAAALVVTLAGCSDDSAGPGPNPAPGSTASLTIDASSNTQYQYFAFSSGALVPVTNAFTDQSWDLAFRRFEIRLNGGVAGPKGVRAYNMANNATATSAQVIGFTAANQQAAFDAVTAADIPASPDSFRTASLAATRTAWFRPVFTPQGAVLVANPQNFWKVRLTTSNRFAVLRVDSLSATGGANTNAVFTFFRLRLRLQDGAAGTLGAAQNVVIGAPGPSATGTAVNLSTGAVVTAPSGCNWDVRIFADSRFEVNGAPPCTAGTFPAQPFEPAFDAMTTASDAPQYGPFVAAFDGPIPNTFEDPRGPFLYNIDPTNPNRLFPTFNIFLVQVGSAVYKLQATGYFNPNNATQSGWPTIRWARLR